jgi:hypothetical protein
MTSWISAVTSKKRVAPEPVSIFPQNTGIFETKTREPTIVTTLYNIPDKYFFSARKLWLKQFLQETTYQVIVFTEPQWADELALCRQGQEDRTTIVVLEKSRWISVVRFIPNLWSQQVKQDPELSLNRTVEQFQFGYEKKEFMVKATEMNPFKSVDFIWMDNSALNREWKNTLTFPLVDKIPTDRLLVANPEYFTADDLASSYFKGKKRVDNSILAGSEKQWKDYAKVYDVVMNQKLKVSQFVGDDLLMLHYCIIHKPNQFCLVKQDSLFSYLS